MGHFLLSIRRAKGCRQLDYTIRFPAIRISFWPIRSQVMAGKERPTRLWFYKRASLLCYSEPFHICFPADEFGHQIRFYHFLLRWSNIEIVNSIFSANDCSASPPPFVGCVDDVSEALFAVKLYSVGCKELKI